MNNRDIERTIDKNTFERNVLIVQKYMENKPETDQDQKEFLDAYVSFTTLGKKYMLSRSKYDKAIYQWMRQFVEEHLAGFQKDLVDN